MPHRIPLLDLIRSAAVLGMIAFHFSYDLVMFGVIPRDYAATPLFYYHARLVAGSFLLLAGVGLWLAHGQAIRWPAFWRRFGKLAAAAAAVSLATRIAMPDYYIYFGILHAIALYSLLGLATLRLPAPVTTLIAAGFIAGSYLWKSEAFNAPLLRFLGLATEPAYTMDFEPVFPWFAATLLGIALGRFGSKTGLWQSLSRPATPLIHSLSWPGRHSLLIYLIHQPILMGLVWAYTRL
ncbi:MAG: Uncharacterized protein FD162_2111 [Rhodobacteraceae bacterium]|uniref:heparan-alpha-glucosaminide N-acetyltransferase n=1 Tax=Cypionkella sp. TaxID=2811411 RepID=UPI001326830B|nr:heparan-alpha-glucosaminide N-acetyltransferase [Cypionkella sp.]KAF0172834.1 MAG: Uncharacterized protein FD162_2111 [Paracoccaceae bacterium]MDO8327801.1 heparan-alpha-glucosaminide N-acetyltransferase [Cypionkella sp.]